ncbi:MAG: sensor domain-containing diguanylate cyclase [Pseudomonadota bacterium]
MNAVRRLARQLLATLLLTLVAQAQALEALTINEGFKRLSPDNNTEFLRDTSGTLDAARIIADPALPWQPTGGTLSLGYTTDTVWLRFALRRGENAPAVIRLMVANPLLDELDVMLVDGTSTPRIWLLGDTRPAANRPLPHRNYVVPVALPADRELTVYLRVRSHGALKFPVTLWDLPAFFAHEQRELPGFAFVYGAIFSAILVYFFVARGQREPGFPFALLFVLGLAVYQAHIDGLIGQYLPVEGVWWNQYKTAVLALLTTVIGLRFTNRFLDLPPRAPVTRLPLRIAWIAYGIVLPATLLIAGHRALPLITAALLLYAVAGVLLGVYALYRRLPHAGIYTIVMALFLTGAVVSVLDRFGVHPYSQRLQDVLLACVFLQVVVLGYVLAHRIRRDMRERELAEQHALAARKRAVAAQWHQTYELEREVERQTEALSQTMKELREANHRLAEMSEHDGLTGLHNRRHFDERWPGLVQMAARRDEPLAVMMIDVDHFKRFNDEQGHMSGDECLRQVAAVLRRIISRSTDLVARYGGEEFVAVLPDTGSEEAAGIAERVRIAIETMQVECEKGPVRVTASIGLAARIPKALEGATLLADADAALYRAKSRGRNRVERWLAAAQTESGA